MKKTIIIIYIFYLIIIPKISFSQSATLSGDFRNATMNVDRSGDIKLQVQTDSDGSPCSVGGVTASKGEKLIFDSKGNLKTKIAGFWFGQGGRTYSVIFRTPKGDDFAIIHLKGIVRWNANGKLIEGHNNFLKITTQGDNNKFYKIVSSNMRGGRFEISTENNKKFHCCPAR